MQSTSNQDNFETDSTTNHQNNLNVFNKPTSSSTFSFLSAFGQSKEAESNISKTEVEETETISDTFALKLKEKAANEASAKGQIEPFFFAENDVRLSEADQFLQIKESLSEVRSKYEEKRPMLASIMKKKLKNKAKRQEKMTFGGKKGERKFNPKFKKRPHRK